MSTEPSRESARLHDLDALRAFAMLLGIALHASLSFTGLPWIVTDWRTSPAFGWFLASVHGFRMPLFILISGYFTMMMWRRRGLKALIRQRLLRVALPLAIGVVTIVPAMAWASGWAMKRAERQDERRPAATGARSELVEAVREGKPAEVERLIAGGADPNELDPTSGIPPLMWAAMFGDVPITTALLDRGADIHKTDRGGYSALHSAAFLGQPDVVSLLLERGANPKAVGPYGDSASDSSKADWATTLGITKGLRIPLKPQDEVESARARVRKILAAKGGGSDEEPASSGWSLDSLRKAYAGFLTSDRFLIGEKGKADAFHLILTPVFDHLWFLWYLCWLVGGFAIVVGLAGRFPGRRSPRAAILSRARLLWLVPLTMIPQLFMGTIGPGFGPDTSVGLIPQPHVLLYYAIFFAFGALYFDCDDQDNRLGRGWKIGLPVALLLVFPMGLITVGLTVPSGILQVIYTWSMSFAFIGLFRHFMTDERRAVRYLSDSAYWLYLMHLVPVVLLQGWVRTWEIPAIAKFLFICVVVTSVLLVTYQTLVRYTVVGRLLNGPRTRPAKPLAVDGSTAAVAP